jgi:ABC-type oligopeptide transport system substrate-binding subunit
VWSWSATPHTSAAAIAKGFRSAALSELTAAVHPLFLTGYRAFADELLGADYPDADAFVHILHTQEGHLGRRCGTPEIDRLIERARAEAVPAVRHALYREIEELIAGEAILLPLFHEQTYRFARPEVEGLTVSFGFPTVAFENLRVRG